MRLQCIAIESRLSFWQNRRCVIITECYFNDWWPSIFVKTWKNEMAGLMEFNKFLLLLVPQIWPRFWEEEEENIDRTEAWCGSATVGIHGSLAGEDRALSCRSFYVSCCQHFIQLIIAFCLLMGLSWFLLLSLSSFSGECGVSSQGNWRGR